MEFGLITFADMLPESSSGSGVNAEKRLAELMEEIQLADQLGLDVFGVGEHHRPDYAVSTPAVILAAAAVLTKNIKLSSAVTVLSSDDPVRVFQDFATVDLLSHGRAEIMAGRGSFIESFPLFGNNLNDYNELFCEKLELLLKLNEGEMISWKGKHRPSIDNRGVYPRPVKGKIPVWIAVGGTPESAVRAAKLRLPLTLAIIGGMPEQFVPFINLYRETTLSEGTNKNEIQLGVNNHFYVGENSESTAKEFYPHYAAVMNRVGRERGWPPLSEAQYNQLRSPKGALMVGSVDQVIEKILYEHELFGNTRFMAQASIGTLPHELTMKSIELFGSKVVPAVKKALSHQLS